jgi:hypothetical protein
MSTDRDKALVRHYFEKVEKGGNLDLLDES